MPFVLGVIVLAYHVHYFHFFFALLVQGMQKPDWKVISTLHIRDAHPIHIPFLENLSAPALDEVVEAHGEFGHASAQVVEVEV